MIWQITWLYEWIWRIGQIGPRTEGCPLTSKDDSRNVWIILQRCKNGWQTVANLGIETIQSIRSIDWHNYHLFARIWQCLAQLQDHRRRRRRQRIRRHGHWIWSVSTTVRESETLHTNVSKSAKRKETVYPFYPVLHDVKVRNVSTVVLEWQLLLPRTNTSCSQGLYPLLVPITNRHDTVQWMMIMSTCDLSPHGHLGMTIEILLRSKISKIFRCWLDFLQPFLNTDILLAHLYSTSILVGFWV